MILKKALAAKHQEVEGLKLQMAKIRQVAEFDRKHPIMAATVVGTANIAKGIGATAWKFLKASHPSLRRRLGMARRGGAWHTDEFMRDLMDGKRRMRKNMFEAAAAANKKDTMRARKAGEKGTRDERKEFKRKAKKLAEG